MYRRKVLERVDKVDNALGKGTFPSPNLTPQSALRRGLSVVIRLDEQDAMHMSSVLTLKGVVAYSFSTD